MYNHLVVERLGLVVVFNILNWTSTVLIVSLVQLIASFIVAFNTHHLSIQSWCLQIWKCQESSYSSSAQHVQVHRSMHNLKNSCTVHYISSLMSVLHYTSSPLHLVKLNGLTLTPTVSFINDSSEHHVDNVLSL